MANSIQTAKLLLKETSEIRKKCEAQYKETGTAYNIFKTAGISEKEVPMCNVLLDLLDPKGIHYQGNAYLKLFMEKVVIPRIKGVEAFDLSKAKVKKQSLTDEGRLIDIEISDGKVFIFIEAKINAGEQPKQLTDYANESRKRNKAVGFIPVLFLTKDGHSSGQQVPEDNYVCKSFEKDIVSWLEACLEKTKKVAPVREIIKQYIKAIKSFCGKMEDEAMEKEINKLVMASRDSYIAALQISKVVDELDGKVRQIFENQILKSVEEQFPDMNCFPIDGTLWYEIPLRNGLIFSVNYVIRIFTVQFVKGKKPADERVKEISNKMSGIFDVNDEAKKGFIWYSRNTRYPDLKAIDDDNIYKYELYRIYSKEKGQQAVADWIVSIATELED